MATNDDGSNDVSVRVPRTLISHLIATTLTAILSSGGTFGLAYSMSGGFSQESGVRLEEKVSTLIESQRGLVTEVKSLRSEWNQADLPQRTEIESTHDEFEKRLRQIERDYDGRIRMLEALVNSYSANRR